jgi:hypothetical protein
MLYNLKNALESARKVISRPIMTLQLQVKVPIAILVRQSGQGEE